MRAMTLRVVLRGILWVVFLCAPLALGDAIDDLIKAEMEKRHVPGVAVAVVKDGRVEKVAGYGLANVELNVAVTTKTVFQIQSITKTFTSAAVLKLVEEGKLSLDDAVGKHLKDAPEAWKEITLRHLLSHTSGIKDFINEPTASLRIEVMEAEVLKATSPRALNFAAGEKYAYSNTNYHLLAMIIRQVTGKSYGDFLKERIFDPLEMKDTRVVSLSEIIPNRASGYTWDGTRFRNGLFVAETILSYGGGGIVSTVEDMTKWATALDGEALLKRSTLEDAWSGAPLNNGSKATYGLGWSLGTVNGHRFVAHGGAHMTGFTSHMVKYRDDKLSIIVLTNARNANPSRLARMVAGMVIPGLAQE